MPTFFCCSDTHGKSPPNYPERDLDGWLHAGDVCDKLWVGRPLPKSNNVMEIRDWVSSRTKPVCAVHGNHDTFDGAKFFAACHDITGSVIEVAGVRIVGVGWCGMDFADLPGNPELQSVANDCLRIFNRFSDMKPVVLLMHYPFLSPDGEIKSVPLRDLVNDLRPVAVVQGHLHEWAATHYRFDAGKFSSLVLNPSSAGMLLRISESGAECHLAEHRH